MDMDIPDPNELQWLEEEYLLEEEESGTEHPPYSFPDQDEEPSSEVQQPQPQTLPDSEHSFSSASPDNDDGSKKRLRSQFDTSANGKLFGGDKRSRVVAEAEVGNWDDDWQRQDKCLSWYASEIDGDCIPITGPRGERVYAKIEKHSSTDVRTFAMPLHAHSSGLISVPVSTLLQRAEQDAFLKALQASSEVENDLLRPEASVATEELWVNKYAPKCFTELLSDEQTNREVLLWLKQWDSTVFGVDIKNAADEVLDALRRHSSASHHQKHFNTSFIRRNKGSISTEKYFGRSTVLDEENIRSKGIHGLQNKKLRVTGPPEQKVLLLCGPPGLGKTTLAHVAAKRCGYHVVEINASDDRSSATIEPKILDAVQMNSVMADSKPKCLIIDEIDGALGEGKGAVEVILKMVAMDRGKEGSAKEDQLGMKSVKRGRKALPLLRPVICICNDIYAPPLRPLRQVAKVHVCGQPTVSRVVSRLKYICNKEGLMTSCTVLTALAEHTECDIRSCLNTLQFLHKKKEGLNLPAISSHSVGRKDMTRSIFDIWKEVFQTRKMKRSKKSDMSEIVINDAPDSLYSLINNRGDYELICDGIHENILRLHYHDPLMQKTVDCLDAIGISDLFHHHVMSSHNMSLYAYHATAIINVRVLLGQVERPIIEWPKSFMRYRTLLMENLEILRSWHSKITPCISRHLSVKSFVQDTVSSLLHILSPPTLRPVALHLLTEKEKNDLDQVVSTMISCSITYKNMKSIPLSNMGCEGMMDPLPLSLDPPLQQFTGFKGYKSGYHELPSAVKQILVHEVEKQKILLGSKARSMLSKDSWTEEGIASGTEQNGMLESAMMHSTATRAGYNAERSRNRSNMSVSDPSISKNPLSLESGGGSAAVAKSRTPGETKKPSIGTVSFFDRFKRLGGKFPANVDSPIQKPVTLERDSRLVLFKYNEGFTNAVKRPVRVRDIIA